MRIIFFSLCSLFMSVTAFSQVDTIRGEAAAKLTAEITKKAIDTNSFLTDFGKSACKCVDSISTTNKNQKEVSKEISDCIDKQTSVYQLSMKLYQSMVSGGKNNEISINMDKKSRDYELYYRRIENWLMENCKPLQKVVAANDKESEKSISENENARAAYTRGVEQMLKENYKDARDLFKTAVALDPQFAFAWDNLGLCHRKLGNLDEALAAYNKSLGIDPKGKLPLQNIAIVYEYKKEYDKALDAYRNLLKFYPDDPEAWYGEGRIFAYYKIDMEKALDAMCKAYNIYTNTSSPYRVDAEKNINYIYGKMKEAGKEKRFYEILKENKISAN